MVTQAWKEIPKTIRVNYTALIIFEICNEKELEVLHDEFGMGCINKEKWLTMYHYATKDPFSFMYYNIQPKDRRKRVMKNFEEYIFMADAGTSGGKDDSEMILMT